MFLPFFFYFFILNCSFFQICKYKYIFKIYNNLQNCLYVYQKICTYHRNSSRLVLGQVVQLISEEHLWPIHWFRLKTHEFDTVLSLFEWPIRKSQHLRVICAWDGLYWPGCMLLRATSEDNATEIYLFITYILLHLIFHYVQFRKQAHNSSSQFLLLWCCILVCHKSFGSSILRKMYVYTHTFFYYLK